MELTVVKNESSVNISERMIDFVRMLSNGDRPEKIAEKYKISRRTVESHLDSLRRKTNCKTISQLVALFIRSKLIE